MPISSPRRADQLEVVRGRFREAEARVDDHLRARDAGLLGDREALAQTEADILQEVAVLGSDAGCAWQPRPFRDARRSRRPCRGSPRSPQTSLTITAPASSAAAATAALRVSMLIGTGQPAGQLADHRQHPRQLDLGGDLFAGPRRPGALAADVDDVRALSTRAIPRAPPPRRRRRRPRRRRTSRA